MTNSVTSSSKNTSPKNIIANELKMHQINPNVLKYNVEKIIINLLMDFNQPTSDEERGHLVNRVCRILYYERKNMLWGEFIDVVNRGIEGYFGNTIKVTVRSLLMWFNEYRKLMEKTKAKMFQSEAVSRQKESKSDFSMSQYFARAYIMRSDYPELKKYSFEAVALEAKKGKTAKEILKSLQNEDRS